MNLVITLGGEVVSLEQLTDREYEIVRRETIRQFLLLANKKNKSKKDISNLEQFSRYIHDNFNEVFDYVQ